LARVLLRVSPCEDCPRRLGSSDGVGEMPKPERLICAAEVPATSPSGLGDKLGLGEGLGLGVGVGVGVGVGDGDGVGEGEGVGVGLGEGEGQVLVIVMS